MKFSLDKFLRLHIRGKLAIAFTGLSVFPVLILGYLAISSNVQTLRRVAIEDLRHDVLTVKERMRSFWAGIDDNLATVMSSSAFQEFLDGVALRDSSKVDEALRRLRPEILNFARRKGIYYQLKFIDFSGDELFAVERSGQDYRVVSNEELNRTGTTFYLYLARKASGVTPVFIPVEIIVSGTQKLLPGISYILPIYRKNFLGVMIVQIYAQSFFKIVEERTPHSPEGKIMLVNSQGYYLYHSEKKRDWNQLLASKDVLNLKADYGDAVVSRVFSSDSSSEVIDLKNELVIHVPLFDMNSALKNEYTLLKSVSKARIFAPADSFKRIFWGLLWAFLAVSLFLAYIATRQFTRPLEKLNREAAVIAQGDYQSRVDVFTYDEIGELAKQFNIMAESLEQRDAEIARQHERLEQMVRERTRELRKEKNKLQAILDNVPSGFILLDKNYTVLSASAALESISGQPVNRLIGRPCEEVIGGGHLCAGCPTDEVFRSGKMQTQTVRHVNRNGEERHLELLSVPLKKNGRVTNVLEIITDITDRKRLQDQLLRSERLAATGEMAAVIAHEMRNSLTSVRMILQLLYESESFPAAEEESFTVALDSLSRMERVVEELLQLARPASLQKKPENINDVLLESIEFVRHRISQKDIDLQIRVCSDLPAVLLDKEHVKETFINLILNALQAIGSKGCIRIRTELTTLGKTHRNLAEIPKHSGNDAALEVRELVLKMGTRAIRVEIQDTGCGIKKEHLKRVFDPFFTTKLSGTGLGLSFVKRVVNEHQGIVSVKSTPGSGSCFTIFIPVSSEPKSET